MAKPARDSITLLFAFDVPIIGPDSAQVCEKILLSWRNSMPDDPA
jgi:hypothetical protein